MTRPPNRGRRRKRAFEEVRGPQDLGLLVGAGISWKEEGPPSRRSLCPPNERSVRISRTTLYRTVAGTTPGREFTDEVPTQVIQPGQSEVKPKPLVGIPSPKPGLL